MLAIHRRAVLAGLSGLALTGAGLRVAPAALRFGAARPFGFADLRALAQRLAAQPWRPPPSPPPAVASIDFDGAQKIRFRPEDALWRGLAGADPIAFFHLSRFSSQPVILHALEEGMARQILYSPDYFDYGSSGIDPESLGRLGFAGFRVMDGQQGKTDWLAFQGASYFRASGQDGQYGASARGIAVNTAMPQPEEFPRFSQFWLAQQGESITILALLEGPSLTGAYRFDCRKAQGAIMDVHCALFLRADIPRLGIAPLTSMYWYGENERRRAADWRPEIHDSDGLSLWTGKGERLWRPLIDPPLVETNAFADTDPRGFGLMQRDRDFEDYQDDGAFYNKRPGIWVEPKGKWGPGAVELVEIPTDNETQDNIVAYWRPKTPARRGDRLDFDYRLYWQDAVPDYPSAIARVVATRIGRGGMPGQDPWPANLRKFVIDFAGGALDQLQQRYDVTPVVTLPGGGAAQNAYVVKVVGTNRWRALFDVPIDGVGNGGAIDLRCFLRLGDQTLSETWIYQYFP